MGPVQEVKNVVDSLAILCHTGPDSRGLGQVRQVCAVELHACGGLPHAAPSSSGPDLLMPHVVEPISSVFAPHRDACRRMFSILPLRMFFPPSLVSHTTQADFLSVVQVHTVCANTDGKPS